MLSVWKDLNYAVRSLGKSRSVTAVGILSIALGIGVNITAFSIVRELVFDDVTAQRAVDVYVPKNMAQEIRTARAHGKTPYN